MELKPEDLKIDVFHAKRVGGWSTAQPVAVSILHKPSGIIVTKSDDRSVHRNRANAYADLCEAVAKYEAIAKTTIAPSQVKLYGCHDRPRPLLGVTTHHAQAGWKYGPGSTTRTPVMVPIHHVFTTACMYDISDKDKRCSGCKHIRK